MTDTGTPMTSGRVTSRDGTPIGYLKTGRGPAVVIMHGSMESARSHPQHPPGDAVKSAATMEPNELSPADIADRGEQHQDEGGDGQDAVQEDDRHREVPVRYTAIQRVAMIRPRTATVPRAATVAQASRFWLSRR